MNRGTTSNLGYPRLDENREWKKALQAFREAKEKLGIPGKPVMVGPYTFVKLSKGVTNEAETLSRLLPLYVQMLQELEEAGAEWVQMDEPILVTSLSRDEMEQVVRIYTRIQASLPSLKIMLQTYFDVVEWYEDLLRLPVQGIGLDFVHGREENLANLRRYGFPPDKILGAGVIDGRNVWKTDLLDTHALLQDMYRHVSPERVWLQPSRSHGELIAAFERESYDKQIGLGVCDIHSPRIPSVEEMASTIERAIRVIDPARFWINPDCGLKTRQPAETIAPLKHMVEAAHRVRARLSRFQQASKE